MYKNLIEELTFEEFKNKCEANEIQSSMGIDKAIVLDFIGSEPESQVEILMNILVDNEIVFSVELNPNNIFEKIYAIKSNDIIDVIAILQDNKLDIEKFKEVYPDTYDNFTVKNYLINQEIFIDKVNNKEEYDPLNFKESQMKIDQIKNDYEQGNISFGEYLKKLGVIEDEDYDNQKVIDTIEKIVNREVNVKDLADMFNTQEINVMELSEINNVLKKKYPEIYEQFNEQY